MFCCVTAGQTIQLDATYIELRRVRWGGEETKRNREGRREKRGKKVGEGEGKEGNEMKGRKEKEGNERKERKEREGEEGFLSH